MINNRNTEFMSQAGHLTDEAIAACAEAMMNPKRQRDLPDVVSSHLIECEICNDRVTGLFLDVKDAPEILERVTAPPVSDKSVFFSSRRILKFAAAAILLILVAAGSYFMLRAPSSEKLFTSNFEPYPNMITTKSNVINEKAVAMLYYELNDWDSAIILLNQYLTKKSYTPDVMFYLGNAYLAKGDSEQAIRWLKEASTMSSGFDDQINWYLALAYLRQDDQGSARVYLETLCQKDDFYQLKAEKLLKKIR